MRTALFLQTFFLSIVCYSQTHTSDFLTIENIRPADSLLLAGQFEASLEWLQKAAKTFHHDRRSLACVHLLQAANYLELSEIEKVFEHARRVQRLLESPGTDRLLWVRSDRALSEGFLAQHLYDSAEFYQNRTLVLAQSANNDLQLARCYELQGDILMKTKRADKALENYLRSLKMVKMSQSNQRALATVYRKIASVYVDLPDFEQARLYLDSTLSIERNLYRYDHLEMGKTFYQSGVLHALLNEFGDAFVQIDRAQKIFETHLPGTHPLVVACHKATGDVHFDRGDFMLSLDYYEQALELSTERWGKNSLPVATMYNDIAIVYYETGNYIKALEYLSQGLEISKNRVGKNHPLIALLSFNTGLNYLTLGKDSLALDYLKRSLESRMAVLGENHYYVADCYGVIAGIYRYRGEMEKAMEYYHRALKICKKIYWKDLRMVFCYYHIGTLYKELNRLEEALECAHKSIIYNIIPFDDPNPCSQPPLHGFLNKNMLPLSMQLKAELFRLKYDRDGDLSDLYSSLETYCAYDSLVDKIRSSHLRNKDKLVLGTKLVAAYEGAIDVCLELYEQTQKLRYYNLAVYFSERNKAAILVESMRYDLLNREGKVPQEILELEASVKGELENSRSLLLRRKRVGDQSSVSRIEQRIFRLQRKLDSLELKIEETFPPFYQSSQMAIKNVSDIRKSLASNILFIEFFEGEKEIFVFGISTEGHSVLRFPNDSVYQRHLDIFRQNFSNSANRNPITCPKYVLSAKKLYDLLLKGTLDRLSEKGEISNLLIVPDGRLNYIPFEALLVQVPDGPVPHYANLDYLIRHFAIGYSYSSTMSFAKKKKRPSNHHYLAFAPSYAEYQNDSAVHLALGKFRDAIVPLAWTRREVSAISQKLGGRHFLDDAAVESAFKKEASDYGILHLAMHALVDDEDPMNSRFVFSQNSEDGEDGYLYAFELYNMKLNADLAVLSACYTGYGQLARGEGLMSLARGFLYAGVDNLVTSLWQVADQPTSDLMIYFYEELEKGVPYALALQRAKLKYLALADENTSDPFYWSSFVYVGDINASVSKHYPWKWIIAGTIVLLTGGFLLRKKRVRQSSWMARS